MIVFSIGILSIHDYSCRQTKNKSLLLLLFYYYFYYSDFFSLPELYFFLLHPVLFVFICVRVSYVVFMY